MEDSPVASEKPGTVHQVAYHQLRREEQGQMSNLLGTGVPVAPVTLLVRREKLAQPQQMERADLRGKTHNEAGIILNHVKPNTGNVKPKFKIILCIDVHIELTDKMCAIEKSA